MEETNRKLKSSGYTIKGGNLVRAAAGVGTARTSSAGASRPAAASGVNP